ncbi:LPS-induced tumor necrosis factor alpha factor [Penicillium cosmopolitanum]|uniref:LPS-induced tumor necrosis factor alpha factor n=1 Tax=Penicillium cosmopolitanum TaxID=1131564 RepID=A0A9W9VBX8_9EURO|nr:LPS-induced tumor necrosis factor alpha factor [Penicillium cosmopolitanum]KAJ5376463.1 LPS-induced tumor necrosis factor alpha factor [Penicillium cosmopolitanum]
MAEHNQINNQNSEGLTPLAAPPYSGSIQPAPSEATGAHSEKPPLHGDYNAPTPAHTNESARAYQGQPTGYATVTPLHALLSVPCPVDCPCCGKREMTRIEAVSGTKTHGWAAVLCCCFCLGCIPYLMSSLKDVNHYCSQCSAKLATWHNSGRVEVLQTGQRE